MSMQASINRLFYKLSSLKPILKPTSILELNSLPLSNIRGKLLDKEVFHFTSYILHLTFSLMLIIIFSQNTSSAQTTSSTKASLFTKTNTGEYYTLYSNGVKKEDAYIGGFKSAQLDPLEENVYFFDPALKVIGKINIDSGLVYKVIGKPKSTATSNYQNPIKLSDSSLSKLIDFTLDKYGNIFILDSSETNNNQNPRILKASLKEGNIQEVLNINEQFKRAFISQHLYDVSFSLSGLAYNNNDGYIYLYGTSSCSDIWPFNNGTSKTAAILRFDLRANTISYFGGSDASKIAGYNPKIYFDFNNAQNFTITGLNFDNENNFYITGVDSSNNSYITYKTTLLNDTFTLEQFIGDNNTSASDIGDGGAAKNAFVCLKGVRSIIQNKNGDFFLADFISNRIRKILKENSFITTVVGDGKESLNFGEAKELKNIALQNPQALLVDKYNNFYIIELNRIIQIKNLIQRNEKPAEQVKIANIAITKIADKEVVNPKGEINLPDLAFDYSYAGEQNIEVSTQNIPDGTNIKLLYTDTNTTIANNKLINNKAIIPIKIEAGTTKIIKAETDPFIPAPGVYLPNNAPKIEPGQLPQEPPINKTNRDTVNLPGNLLPLSTRFNFANTGWQRYQNTSEVKLNTGVDPDNLVTDATYVSFGSTPNSLWLDNQGNSGKRVTFSIWMRSDAGNISVPIGIGPACPDLNRNQQNYWSSWVGCNYPTYLATNQFGNLSLFSYSIATVTPAWQKFSVTSNINLDSYNKALFIGGLNYTNNQKIYTWGARLEAIQ